MKIALLILFLFTSLLWTKSTKQEKSQKEEIEKISVWEGEISAVYKDKGKIHALIPLNHELTGKSFEEIQNSIQKIKRFSLRQKITKKKIGVFEVNYVEFVRNVENGKKKEIEVALFGKLIPKKKDYLNLVSNDFYISVIQEEVVYEDPSGMFNEKPSKPATVIIHPKDKKEMVLVPAGLFIYGQGVDGTSDDYNPAFQNPGLDNLMEIPSFYIDKYEVTNAEYDRFLKETHGTPPSYWKNGEIPPGKEDHPVISLTYREVEAYAAWAGKRIPTEFEWEKAARGSGVVITKDKKENLVFEIKTIIYPFGNKYDARLCNCKDNGANDTISVYELPTKGASVYGVIGMCGNAPEWTSSWYEPYAGHYFDSSVTGKAVKVVRGGAFYEPKKNCTVFARSFGGLPNLSEDRRAGFRLVIDKND